MLLDIARFGEPWVHRALRLVTKAFPEYKGFDLQQIMMAEMLQHKHILQHVEGYVVVEAMAGIDNLSKSYEKLGMYAPWCHSSGNQ